VLAESSRVLEGLYFLYELKNFKNEMQTWIKKNYFLYKLKDFKSEMKTCIQIVGSFKSFGKPSRNGVSNF